MLSFLARVGIRSDRNRVCLSTDPNPTSSGFDVKPENIVPDRILVSIRYGPIRVNDKHGTSPVTPDFITSLHDPARPDRLGVPSMSNWIYSDGKLCFVAFNIHYPVTFPNVTGNLANTFSYCTFPSHINITG